MKKITVITLQNIRNYGSALQAVATQTVFERLNCRVDFINYRRKNGATIISRIKNWTSNMSVLKKIVYGLVLYPTFWRQERIFKFFIKRFLRQQKKEFTCIDDFKDFPIDSDIYCTGSDQTWNSSWNGGVLPEMFLDFVPMNVRKISYAASIGKPMLEKSEIEKMRNYLKSYYRISVRENSAKKIIEKQLGIPFVTQVLDPTLQVEGEYWRSILTEKQKNRRGKGRYVLIYQLNSNAEFDSYAKEFARRKGWKLVRLCTRFDQIIKNGCSVLVPSVTEFVSLIANAGCVITDSFHATAFSCNMNVPMIAIYPTSFSSRLDSLLKLLGLEDRHLLDFSDFSYVNRTEIDFSNVNKLLEQERKIGWDFLEEAIADK